MSLDIGSTKIAMPCIHKLFIRVYVKEMLDASLKHLGNLTEVPSISVGEVSSLKSVTG